MMTASRRRGNTSRASIGGRVWFCYFWEEHDSMVQLTEDCSGKFTVAYVLDSDVTPEVRKAAALHAQQQLAECMQEWDVPLMKSAIPEKDKCESTICSFGQS